MNKTLLSAGAAGMLALGTWSVSAGATPLGSGIDGLRSPNGLVQQADYDGDNWRRDRWWWRHHRDDDGGGWWWRHHHDDDDGGWWWRHHRRFDRDDDRRRAWRDRDDRYDRYDR